VGLEFFGRADDDFVQHLPGVHRDQAHGFTELHLDGVGREAHVVGHADFDGALGVLGLAITDCP